MKTICIGSAQEWVRSAWKRNPKKNQEKDEILYLMEEMGEAAECIRKINGNKEGACSKEELEKEFGDILLSLMTWANRHNISLEKGFMLSMESSRRRGRI